MRRNQPFIYITAADFLVRSAYQMGKTPLLPIFAAALGATGAFLGIIVSVSTLTGMILKPFVGAFSDRWGRRSWLVLGTLFFAIMPFVYRFVETPGQLFAVRIVHGLATAIYGPVTLAYVMEQTSGSRAESVGVFGMARSAGYVVGPAAAGWLLLTMDPVAVFTIIGVLSSLAFFPILALSEPKAPRVEPRLSLRLQLARAVRASSRAPSVWLSGALEGTAYVALYATKSFLPIYALASGVNVAVVGTFFALQEVIHMVLKPFGGRLGDRRGFVPVISAGMVILSIALTMLTSVTNGLSLMIVAVLMGLAQALIFPSTTALVAAQVDQDNLGTGMGVIGTFENAGKVIGPVLGGLLLQRLDFARTFHLLGAMLLVGAVLILVGNRLLPQLQERPRTDFV